MAWTSPLDSRPLRPVPVLWLLVPWAALFAWSASLVVDLALSAPAHQPPGTFAGAPSGVLEAVALWGGVWAGRIGLGAAWLWLALAVPGLRRPGLWLAAALLAVPRLLPRDADAGRTAAAIALLCCGASLGVIHSVITARLRAREVWGSPNEAGV
jgi:hypothetical protein